METKNYLSKCLLALFGLTCFTSFAQVKQPVLTEITIPVEIGDAKEDFPFLYEVVSAWGDYDNDGRLDLIIAGVGAEGEKTILYKNNGNGNFTKVNHSFPNLKQSNATWFDYNNDGNLDLFLAGWDGSSRYSGLWKNKGASGNFEFEEVLQDAFPAINNGGGNRSNRYVVAGDYNNDGWTDLYLQGQTGNDKNTRISQLYKNVNGERFEPVEKPVRSPTGNEKPFIHLAGGSAAWADYDGDGFLDLIVSGEAIDADRYDADYGYHGSYNGAIYRNNSGNGTFFEPIEFLGTEEGDVCWIDYNNDGKTDHIVAGVSWQGNWMWLGDIFINNNGQFVRNEAATTGLPNNRQSISTTVGDVNNDGFEDILYLNAPGADALYLNNGGLTDGSVMFTKQELVYSSASVAQRGGTANLIDFNNDNNLDAFLIGYGDNSESHGRLMKNDLSEGIAVNQAPGAPTNLSVMQGQGGLAFFSWDAPSDDQTPAAALKYNLFIRQGDKTRMILPADLSTGRLKVEETSAAIKKRTMYRVIGLEGEYTWGVQAIDNAKAAGPFAVFGFSGNPEIRNRSINVIGENKSILIKAAENLKGTLTVYSVSGVNLYSKTGTIGNTTIQIPEGAYIVKITSSEGSFAEKVIVR